ncbi:beta-ketoacyl-ACP synthase [Piscinibacter sp.]|jgi:3-oxoacyl-[acyl-carrier-protein] synthase-1|uniref:beta-ketoacyl-ACP synthase n=1 Tax=Piscinibacter sp. TaxID=1903157 RepID=UPI00355A0C91
MAIFLNHLGLVCSLGLGQVGVREALFRADAPQGMTHTEAFSPGRMLQLGEVTAPLPDSSAWPLWHRSRNNALLAAALQEIRPAVDAAIARVGPARVAIVLGGSTSGVREGEAAVRTRRSTGQWPAGYDYRQQELASASAFLAWLLGTAGPAHVISTACSSGAKSLASGARLLQAGLADVVIAGGVDTLCRFTLAGFTALESVSATRCNPLSVNRDGINLGEGAALFVMSRENGPVRLAGWGETSDAHHISGPDPTARGAIDAMNLALTRARVAASEVDYVNLHGTATPQNDAMESRAIVQALGAQVPVSSTKPLTGHALGAAGAIEAGFGWLALVDNPTGLLPPHWWDGQADPELPELHVASPGERLGRPLRHVLSNSFAFGGSNASLLLAQG